MRRVRISDNFYPGISIYKTLRQSPESVFNRYVELLKAKAFATTDENVQILLETSKQLFVFVLKDGREELVQFENETKKSGKQIRGGFLPSFELVFQLLSQTLEYVRGHPRETLETAASLAVLAEYVEKKFGKPAGQIVTKISQRSSKLRTQLSRLSKSKRAAKRRNCSHAKKVRKRTPRYIG